jgi:hypothetical protein
MQHNKPPKPISPANAETNPHPPKKNKFKIDFSLSLSILVPALITVVGWYAGNFIAAHRDRDNKLRDIKIQFDIDIYNQINSGYGKTRSDYKSVNAVGYNELDSAFAKIQLVGTDEQIDSIDDMETRLAARQTVNFDFLIFSIRDDLRKELNIPPTSREISHLNVEIYVRDTASKDSTHQTFHRLKK